jgi:RHH-type proline utilization regulon transcriptional repressor/proline dehydrogenase/delta 1-pyrroline-5-carboxylate dehydrogenase
MPELAKPDGLRAIREWMLANMHLTRGFSEFGTGEAMPGPTGETNTLEFHPRGAVACVAADERKLVAQSRAALASGSTPCFTLENALRAKVSGARIVLADRLDPAAIDAVLLDVAPDGAAHPQELAARVESSRSSSRPRRDLRHSRLVVERTVTINTAAAGECGAAVAVRG